MVPVTVPARVPLPVFSESDTAVELVTLDALPLESCDWTTTENAVPAVALLPPLTDVMASLLAAAVVALTVNALDVAPVNEPSLAVRVLDEPAVVGLTALKVATPLTAAIESVLAVNAVVPLASVTVLVSPVTVLPN